MTYCPRCGTLLTIRCLQGHDRPSCLACGFVYYAGPKVAVGVVIERDGQILLNRRAIDPGKGRWSFPSGYVDVGETTTTAAVREVKEETGYDVTLNGLVGVYSSSPRPIVFIVYSGTIVGGELAHCEEVEETAQFGTNELPPLAFEHDWRIVNDWQSWRRTGVSGGLLV